jgi:hypothetical protein
MALELRAITNSHLMRDNPVTMSSAIPRLDAQLVKSRSHSVCSVMSGW